MIQLSLRKIWIVADSAGLLSISTMKKEITTWVIWTILCWFGSFFTLKWNNFKNMAQMVTK